MTTKEMIEVIQHYENGGEVEGANHVQSVDGTLWYKVTNNKFDFSMNDYRIKECKTKTVYEYLVKDSGGMYAVIACTETDIENWYEGLFNQKTGRSWEVPNA